MDNPRKFSIAYYISAHGYGHGVRSCEIIRSLQDLHPKLQIHVITDLPRSFILNRLPSTPDSIRSISFDVGMVQLDSIRVDVNATLIRLEELYAKQREIVIQEARYLRQNKISLIVVDIPALPLEAASFIGIPRIAVGNFGWDWIYQDFVQRDYRWQSIVSRFRDAYAKADLLLRLPFSEEMGAFPNIEDIPMVATAGRCRRSEIASLTGCDPEKKWILLSFTTLNWSDEALDRVARIQEYDFFTVQPLSWRRDNIHSLNRERVSFSDIIASVDAVISKPGFGIISDCIVNRKPLIYAERSDFPEYPLLKAAIEKYLRHVHIPSEHLYEGKLARSLERAWNSPIPQNIPRQGGAPIAAKRITEFADCT